MKRIKRSWKKPIFCHSCKREIMNGEEYESTFCGKNCFCKECSEKEVLVYPIPSKRKF